MIVCVVHQTKPIVVVLCVHCITQCAVYSAQCAVCSVQCALRSVQADCCGFVSAGKSLRRRAEEEDTAPLIHNTILNFCVFVF